MKRSWQVLWSVYFPTAVRTKGNSHVQRQGRKGEAEEGRRADCIETGFLLVITIGLIVVTCVYKRQCRYTARIANELVVLQWWNVASILNHSHISPTSLFTVSYLQLGAIVPEVSESQLAGKARKRYQLRPNRSKLTAERQTL
jgi:hypothetical protein